MSPLLCLLLWDLLDLVLGECHPPQKITHLYPCKSAADLGFAPPRDLGGLWGGGQVPSLDSIMGDWFWSHLVMERLVWTRKWGAAPPNWCLKPINGVLVLEPLMGETLIEEQLIVDVLIGQLFWIW